MLYPVVNMDVPEGMHEVPSGHLAVAPLPLAASAALRIIVVQVSRTQDHSLRVWISREPGGVSIAYAPISVAYWHANRAPDEVVVLHDDSVPNPTAHPAIAAPPGDYVLNVLNLINSPNVFTVAVSEVP